MRVSNTGLDVRDGTYRSPFPPLFTGRRITWKRGPTASLNLTRRNSNAEASSTGREPGSRRFLCRNYRTWDALHTGYRLWTCKTAAGGTFSWWKRASRCIGETKQWDDTRWWFRASGTCIYIYIYSDDLTIVVLVSETNFNIVDNISKNYKINDEIIMKIDGNAGPMGLSCKDGNRHRSWDV